jgi:hypothetical protein
LGGGFRQRSFNLSIGGNRGGGYGGYGGGYEEYGAYPMMASQAAPMAYQGGYQSYQAPMAAYQAAPMASSCYSSQAMSYGGGGAVYGAPMATPPPPTPQTAPPITPAVYYDVPRAPVETQARTKFASRPAVVMPSYAELMKQEGIDPTDRWYGDAPAWKNVRTAPRASPEPRTEPRTDHRYFTEAPAEAPSPPKSLASRLDKLDTLLEQIQASLSKHDRDVTKLTSVVDVMENRMLTLEAYTRRHDPSPDLKPVEPINVPEPPPARSHH